MSWLKYGPAVIEWYNKFVSGIPDDEVFDSTNLLPEDFWYYLPFGLGIFFIILIVSTVVSCLFKKLAVILGKLLFFILAIAAAIVTLRFAEKKLGVPVETYLENWINDLFPS